MYYKNRYYSAALGRFVGRDPIGYDAGLGLYLYCFSRPIIYLDPVGLECDITGAFVKVSVKVIGAIAVKIGGAKVKRWAAKAIAASAVDGPLPLGEIASGVMAAWDAVQAVAEIADAKAFAKQAFNYVENMMKTKFGNYLDCLNEKPECCELLKNAIDRAGTSIASDITYGRKVSKSLSNLTDIAEDLLKDIVKCCVKPCDLPKIPKNRGHKGGNDWDKHSKKRSGDPEKGDLRRDY